MNLPEKTAVLPYLPACVLRATGPDAYIFLQSQFTNDLGKMTTDGSVYGLWLDRRGRVVADSWVARAGAQEEFLIVSLDSPAAAVEEHLKAHIVADEVEVTDETPQWRAMALIGAGDVTPPEGPGVMLRGRRGAPGCLEWLVPAAQWPGVLSATRGLAPAAQGDLELMRIRARIPRVLQDIGPADIPNEGGLDQDAISYSKGCYTGQEVMARVKALGRVRRVLVHVGGPGVPPAVPAALWSGGLRAGDIRSAAPNAQGYEGLALVQVPPAPAYSLGPGSPAEVSVRAPVAGG